MSGLESRGVGRVDLHSHVMPGVDDGARDAEEALAMLRLAAADGTRVIAATPHATRCTPADIVDGVRRLNALAAAHGIDITVASGSEVRFDSGLAERFQRGELATLNDTPYLLMELSLRSDWSPYLGRGVYDLQMAGAWPILAHAERYPTVQREPERIVELVESGVLIQINADALNGLAGRAAKRAAETLLARHLAHVIASDAHDPRVRPPLLADAYRRAAQVVDADYMSFLTDVPHRIIAGEPVTTPVPIEPRDDSWLGRLRARFGTGA
jgi:protein-tyrosine phosphatase